MKLYEVDPRINSLLFESSWMNLIQKFRNDPTIDRGNFREKLLDLFSSHGWRLIGMGHFAGVYANTKYPNWVYKVFHRDQAYQEWYNFCQNNKHNPHLPKFSNRLHEIELRDGYYAVRMEKLQPITIDEYETKYHPILQFMMIDNPSAEYMVSGWQYRPNPIEARKEFQSSILKYWMALDEETQDYLTEISTFLESSDYSIDFHSDNIMVRPSDGRMVIADPLSDTESGEYTGKLW